MAYLRIQLYPFAVYLDPPHTFGKVEFVDLSPFLPNVTPWLLLLSATYLRFDTLHILLSSSNYNSAHFSLLFCRWLDLLALTGRILKYIQC